jgi:hypothetical protein
VNQSGTYTFRQMKTAAFKELLPFSFKQSYDFPLHSAITLLEGLFLLLRAKHLRYARATLEHLTTVQENDDRRGNG